MNDFIWWIGCAHVVGYTLLCTSGAVWLTLEQVARWTGATGLIIRWYADRLRQRRERGA